MRLQDGTVTFISTAPQPIMALTNTNPFREVMPGWRAMAAGKGRSHMGVCDCSAWRHGGGLEPDMVEGGLGSYKGKMAPSITLCFCCVFPINRSNNPFLSLFSLFLLQLQL